MTGPLGAQADRRFGERARRWLLAFAIALILSASALLRVVEIELLGLRPGRFVAKAEIVDGGPARYVIDLTVSRTDAGWRVSEVADR